MVRSVWWRHLGALVLVLTVGGPSIAWGQGALSKGSLVDYVRGREDLPNKDRRALEAAVRREFGGQALEEEAKAVGKNTFVRSELQVAKAILSAAIFMQVDPKKAAKAAWEGWHDAQRYVPPPIAIHYQVLSLEGRRLRAAPSISPSTSRITTTRRSPPSWWPIGKRRWRRGRSRTTL